MYNQSDILFRCLPRAGDTYVCGMSSPTARRVGGRMKRDSLIGLEFSVIARVFLCTKYRVNTEQIALLQLQCTISLGRSVLRTTVPYERVPNRGVHRCDHCFTCRMGVRWHRARSLCMYQPCAGTLQGRADRRMHCVCLYVQCIGVSSRPLHEAGYA